MFNIWSAHSVQKCFFVIIFNLSLFKLIFYLKSCHVLTISMKFDSAGLERDGSVFVYGTAQPAQDTGFHFESLVSFSEGGPAEGPCLESPVLYCSLVLGQLFIDFSCLIIDYYFLSTFESDLIDLF